MGIAEGGHYTTLSRDEQTGDFFVVNDKTLRPIQPRDTGIDMSYMMFYTDINDSEIDRSKELNSNYSPKSVRSQVAENWQEAKRKRSIISNSSSKESLELNNRYTTLEVEGEDRNDNINISENNEISTKKKMKVGQEDEKCRNHDILMQETETLEEAADTLETPDTFEMPDTSEVPETMKAPDRVVNAESVANPDMLKVADTVDVPDTLEMPDTSEVENPDIVEDGGDDFLESEMAGNIEWRCKTNKVIRERVNSVLPKHVETKINFCQYIKSSDEGHKEENKFKLNMNVKIETIEEIDDYIKALEDRTQSKFGKGRTKTSSAKGWVSNTRCCNRKVRTLLDIKDHEKHRSFGGGGRGVGKGKRGLTRGVPKQIGKHTDCQAYIRYTLKTDKQNEPFKLNIELLYNHNHQVLTNNNFNFNQVSKETEIKIWNLFESGMVPSKALRLFRTDLKKTLGEIGYLKIAANREINPDRTYFFNQYTKFCHQTMGSFNGPDATLKAYELVNQYNKEAGEKLASLTFTENNEIVIVVLDQLAKRVHKLVKQAGDIVYVDGTGSLDRLDTQLVKLMTCSPAGGLPLGFMLLGSKNEATTTAGMKEYKSMLSKDAFFKRGDKGSVCNKGFFSSSINQ